MKKSFHSVAWAATIATTMLFQIFTPSVVLAIDTTEDTEPSTTIETTVTSETSSETSVDVVEPSDTTSDNTDYTEVTESLTETEADVTEVTEEEVIASETNTDPTFVEETEETVETLETEEEIEYVVFDHYYSDIDASMVNTTELFVITSDSSVFTRNTNVVSNYDDAYIIECSSVEEARFVYSYYVDKVDFITDMSDVASVATDETVDETEPVVEETEVSETEPTVEETETTETTVEAEPTTTETTAPTVEQEPDVADLSDLNNGNDAIANLNGIDTVHNDYSGYIALIDTGANAHANFTVLGGDTFDHNGHGTSMFGYIRSENPNAQVVSIKVSEGGTATAADIYAGFRLAIDLNVSVINFSMTAPDIAKNAVIRDIIQEALDAGIVVIGAAGNNAISATHFIPGCIDGVITIGAVDEDGNKVTRSNYNADYYVVADTTSEATARFTGLYTAGIWDISGKVFDQVEEDDDYVPDDYAWAFEVARILTEHLQETYGYGYVEVEIDEDGNVSYRYVMDAIGEDFTPASWPQSDATIEITPPYALANGTYTGTCDYTSTNGGKGYMSNIQGELGRWLSAAGYSTFNVICSKNFGFNESDGARSLPSGTGYFYEATYTNGEWTVMLGHSTNGNVDQPDWEHRDYNITYSVNSDGRVTVTDPFYGTSVGNVDLRTQTATEVIAKIQSLIDSMVSVAEYSGNKNPDFGSATSGVGTRTLRAQYDHTDDYQVYEGRTITNTHGAVSIRKVDENGNGLAGATITITGAFEADARVRYADNISRNGNTFTFTTTASTASIEGLVPNSTYTFTETGAPSGYQIASPQSITFTTDAQGNPTGSSSGQWSWNGNTATFTLTNSGNDLAFRKVDNHDTDLAGAQMLFFCYSGPGTSAENINRLSITGATNVTRTDNGLRYLTTGAIAHISGLAPNSTYIFREEVAPINPVTGERMMLADDIVITTDANCTPSSSSVIMVDVDGPVTDGNYGSFSLTKTWLGSNETTAFFWNSVDSINFGLYAVGWTANDIRTYVTQTSNPLGGVTQLAGGQMNAPTDGSTSSTVLWTYFNSNEFTPIRGADPEWYEWVYTVQDAPNHRSYMCATPYGVENQYGIRRDSTTFFVGLPRDRYFVVTETWDSFMFDGDIEDFYIQTMNRSGWHDIDNDTTDGTHRCAAVYYVNPYNGITYLCDWDTLQPIHALNLHPSPTGQYFYDEYYYDYVENAEATGALDVIKVDQSGMGVDGVRFELRTSNSNRTLLGTGRPGNTLTPIDGYDTYDVLWNYTLIKPGRVWYFQNQEVVGDTIQGEWMRTSAAYNLRDLVPGGDLNRVMYDNPETGSTVCIFSSRDGTRHEYLTGSRFLELYDDWHTWVADGRPLASSDTSDDRINSNYLYGAVNDVVAWRNPLVPMPAKFPSDEVSLWAGWGWTTGNFNRQNLNLNEIHETNAEYVAHLNFGDYYIYEYIEDANGNNIIGTGGYETPDGWTAYDGDNDGVPEYFYILVHVTEANQVTAATTTCVNSVRGRIDLNKTNLTGGPLSDLSFEILEGNTVIATGYIPSTEAPQTTGTQTVTDYTYSVTWDQTLGGTLHTGLAEAVTGLGTFTVREYIPVSVVDDREDLIVSNDWTYGGVTTHSGVNCYYYYKTVVIDDSNADVTQIVSITNEVRPTIGTTLTDFAGRHITVVGENIEFTDLVAYEDCYINATYVMHATLVDENGTPIRDENGYAYGGDATFTTTSGSGTVPVTFTVNTADIVEATEQPDGTVRYSPCFVVCFESMNLVGDYEIANHRDTSDTNQTVDIPNPEIGTQFCDVLTQEHHTVTGRIVEVRDVCSYTNLHIDETYSLTCHLYDANTGTALRYSSGEPVAVTMQFEPQTESGTVNVDFTIDTSDLQVNVFAYEECTLVAFEYLKSSSGILIGGHTDLYDVEQYLQPHLPSPRTSFVDDQTGSRVGRLGSAVPFTDYVYLNNLNIGETYQLRARVVSSNDTSIVWAYETVDFEATARDMTVEVHFTIDTSEICAGSNEAYIVCFEQLWQLDTQGTGRGEVLLARHEDVRDQDQTIHLPPEIHTQMTDPVTNSQYGMIGENVEFIDTVSYYRLHIGETYTVTGILMDKQTGLPVLDENGQPITGTSDPFVPQTTDGTVEVVYHLNTLRLVQQIGQTVGGVTIEAPRELVSFETITSSSGWEFEIHADINDLSQTIVLGDISSGAGDIQTSTSWLASGMTTVRDTVHYCGLGPVEYTLRGSLHLISYDENGNPIDGGLIQARPGEVTETEYTWTPTNHEGDVNLDYRIDSDRFQGQNIIVFEELWYNGVCIISHDHYCDTNGNYGMENLEQTVHVASVWTSAFSFQSGEQLLAYDTNATVTDFAYCGNLEVGQQYYCEASLWACYTDENGYIHNVALTQEEGGIACSPVFTATENHAVAEVTFHIDATKYFDQHYDYLLVTERLIHVGSGVCIATHSDLTSREQSINIPDLHTTASTVAGHTLPEGENPDIQPVTITDRVYYENLIPGKSYTAVGNLQYARTDAQGNITESGALVQNGQPVTASKTFVPEASSGYIDLEFTVNAADIFAHNYDRIVAFEDLYFGPEGIRVGVHADITDEEQTIFVPPVNTPTPTPPETPPKTGDDSGYGDYMFGAVMAVVILAGGIVLLAVLDRKNTGDSNKDEK